MKILHTSDWHLGRFFHNVSLLEDQQAILQQIVIYVEQRSVDVLIIAGDIFDRAIPPVAAITLLDELLNKLCNDMGVHVILIAGNHDSAERLAFGAQHMALGKLHILSDLKKVTEPVIIHNNEHAVAFWGIPYCDPHAVNSVFQTDYKSHNDAHNFLLEKIRTTPINPALPQVLISHCFVAGALTCDSERPLSIGGADNVDLTPLLNFDYVALGHLHGPQFRGEEKIRYSGSPLKYSFSEQHHKKSVCLVSINPDKTLQIETLPLHPVRDMRVIEGSLQSIIRDAALDAHTNDYLMIKLTDRQAILDPIAQLREVYPNVLHLEKLHYVSEVEHPSSEKLLQRDVSNLFNDFFQQLMGQELTQAQTKILKAVVEQAQKEREAKE